MRKTFFLTLSPYQHRKLLAEQAKKNARAAERAYGGIAGECSCQIRCTVRGEPNIRTDGSDSEWDDVGPTSPKGKGRANEGEEEEYEDEEQLATVTVVEEFDPDSLIHGTQPAPKPNKDGDDSEITDRPPDSQPRAKTKPADKSAKTKVKTATRAKDIKYQTGAARKAERQKQRKRKLEKADRAGGKGSRRKGASRGKR